MEELGVVEHVSVLKNVFHDFLRFRTRGHGTVVDFIRVRIVLDIGVHPIVVCVQQARCQVLTNLGYDTGRDTVTAHDVSFQSRGAISEGYAVMVSPYRMSTTMVPSSFIAVIVPRGPP